MLLTQNHPENFSQICHPSCLMCIGKSTPPIPVGFTNRMGADEGGPESDNFLCKLIVCQDFSLDLFLFSVVIS
jgi:hypothetical protein